MCRARAQISGWDVSRVVDFQEMFPTQYYDRTGFSLSATYACRICLAWQSNANWGSYLCNACAPPPAAPQAWPGSVEAALPVFLPVGIVLFLCLCLLTYFCLRRKRSAKPKMMPHPNTELGGRPPPGRQQVGA